ncbi:5-oxoprolinase subunit PxpA [Pelagibacterium limicola]|uniref:5-oxoprolinase subunit PxpA n=1 Tax=Pelagibacterium limicola TaxID=2791022 RepID=UPI0018B00CFE|nr:5-oxoprolinase subunit PxpA [Pelagibacterium limicola]
MRLLDLNADLGEGMGNDAALFEIVTSASIACGGHAGDAQTMRSALRAARVAGVRAGAHPGFNDPGHFGRRRLAQPSEQVAAEVVRQIGALSVIAVEEDVPLAYFKLHGALANMAAEDEGLATTVFSAVTQRYPHLAALVLENSAQHYAAERLGLEAIAEAYADRAYLPNGLLVPRTMEGAVIHDEATVEARGRRLAERGEIVAIDGSVIQSAAISICLHGDTPGAVALARRVRVELERIGALKGKQFTAH